MTAPASSLLLGILLGVASLKSLKWNLDRFVRGRAVSTALAVQLLRLAGVAGVFAVLARFGTGPLLMAAAGMLLSRMWLVRRMAGA